MQWKLQYSLWTWFRSEVVTQFFYIATLWKFRIPKLLRYFFKISNWSEKVLVQTVDSNNYLWGTMNRMSIFLQQRILVTATCILFHIDLGETEFYNESKSTELSISPNPKHISWIYGTATVPSNYSVCDMPTDMNHCFSEYEKSTIYFYLYNRDRNGSEALKLGDLEQLKRSSFRNDLPVKFIIHGFKQTAFSQFSHLLKEAYLLHGNETNVIVVDWRYLASHHNYFHSAFNTRIVGERVGEFIIYLRKTRSIKSYKSVHIIGFSLGAHVAGFAAKLVKRTKKILISRITGLDPAGPAFSRAPKLNRLDYTDAQFVDVIHTCVGRSGITDSIGHVDFYPNGGEDQPGCEWERLHSFILKNCSHERAFQFFLASIKGQQFVGCHCPKWVDFQSGSCRCNSRSVGAEIMGEHCSFQYATHTSPRK